MNKFTVTELSGERFKISGDYDFHFVVIGHADGGASGKVWEGRIPLWSGVQVYLRDGGMFLGGVARRADGLIEYHA